MAILFPLAYDFHYFWAAGRLALDGKDFYDLNLLTTTMQQVGWPSDHTVFRFPYPPWTVWFFVPWAIFPFVWGALLWSAGMLILVGASISALIRSDIGDFRTSPVLQLLAVLIFPPVLLSFLYAQPNAVILSALILAVLRCRNEHYYIGGGIAALMLLKPQIGIPLLGALFLFLKQAARTQYTVGVAIGFLMQLILSCLIAPQALGHYLEKLNEIGSSHIGLAGASLTQFLSKAFGFPAHFWPIVFAVCIFFMVRATLRTRLTPPTEAWRSFFCTSVPWAMLAVPYLWSHSYLTLLPAWTIQIMHMRKHWGSTWIIVPIVTSALTILSVMDPLQWEWLLVVIPVGLLGVEWKRGVQTKTSATGAC